MSDNVYVLIDINEQEVIQSLPHSTKWIWLARGGKVIDMAVYQTAPDLVADFYNGKQRVQASTGAAKRREAEKFVALRIFEVELVTVKELLGHADIKTPMRYAHTNREAKMKAVRCLGVVVTK